MKTNKYVEDLKKKSDAELAQELTDAKKELFNLRFQNATNQLDNTLNRKKIKFHRMLTSKTFAQNSNFHKKNRHFFGKFLKNIIL